MIHKITAILLFMPFLALADSPFKEIDELTAAKRGLHLIVDDEVDLNDGKIKRLTIGTRNLTIQFKNTSSVSYKPNLKIILVDRYGIPVKYASEYWIVNTIDAGEVKLHESTLSPEDMATLLRPTGLKLPQDAGQVKYVYVHYR